MSKLTIEEFIARAKAVHGDRYDYSKVEYVDSKTKVCITCHLQSWMHSRVEHHHPRLLFRKNGSVEKNDENGSRGYKSYNLPALQRGKNVVISPLIAEIID